ncbi:MAG: hypothetical protein IMHGJWDQ_001347 [Candidatus Fervidibacter sp.]
MNERTKKWLFRLLLAVILLLLMAKVFSVRHILWEGSAPVGFERIAQINERLKGRPLWCATSERVRRWLEGEVVSRVTVRWRLPSTVIIVTEAPKFLGVVSSGGKWAAVDDNGRSWGKVPLFATRLPLLMLPCHVSPDQCLPSVERTLSTCLREGLTVRALWVSPFGEVAVYLMEGVWLRLGNPTALSLKVRLGKALRENQLLWTKGVVDLTLPKVISLWSQR